MTSIHDHEKSMLKLAQFKSFMTSNKNIIDKHVVDIIFQGMDLNLKVSSTDFVEYHDSIWIDSVLLHMAHKKLNISAYDILLHKGVKFDIKNKDGNTILHDIIRFSGLKSSYIEWDILNSRMYMTSSKIPFIVSTLSAHVKYKNTNNPSDSNGLTHFHIACTVNHTDAVELFLSSGVPVNQVVTKVDEELFQGYTGLHFAAQFGYFETAQILLKYGANAHLEDAKGRTPLHVSIERNMAMIESTKQVYSLLVILQNERVMNLLLNNTVKSKLPILCAVSAMHNSYQAKKLLDQKSDVNQSVGTESQVWPGYTALHFAAHTSIDTVKLLIKHGANIEAKDVNGVTPFDICIKRYKAEDIYDICCLVKKWRNTLMSDGKTKLVNALFALKDSDQIKNFLTKSDGNVKLFVPLDSPLWPGFSILHLVVLLTERRHCKLDYKTTEEDFYAFTPDVSIIIEFLKRDPDVTFMDHRNWSPVHLAYRLGKTETLNLLLKYHHKTKNIVDDENLSHLHIACAVKNRDVVKKLLWNESEVNIAYQGDSCISDVHPGWTPLHVAVHVEDLEIVKLLLKFDADIHKVDNYGYTPIHELFFLSCPKEISNTLFRASNFRDVIVESSGLSYLHVACLKGNVNGVKKLLNFGVDVNKIINFETEDHKIFPNEFSSKNYNGFTPLHCLMDYYHEEEDDINTSKILNLLLKQNADILIENSRKISPLIKLLEFCRYLLLDVVLAAFERNKDLPKRLEKETGITMLHIACRRVNVDLIKEILDNGANINSKIFENSTMWPGDTPLHVLICSFYDFVEEDYELVPEFDEVVKLLLDRRADVTLTNTKRRTPLHIAYYRLYIELDGSRLTQTNLLLKAHKNFEVNPTSIEGVSHFHIACHLLDADVVENFLEYNVDVNSRINKFCNWDIAAASPLILATRTRNWGQENHTKSLNESFAQLKIVDLLIKHGAQVNVEDIDGNTPAHYAVSCCFPRENLFEVLAKGGANVNARNLQGETALELLLKKKNLALEEIRYFIACGCIFNAFNPFTEEGYIAKATTLLSIGDIQCLLYGTFVSSPDLMERDEMNRTIIHNLVSIKSSKISAMQYAELFNLLVKLGCDIDDQDNAGRTALHLAAQVRNRLAIVGLLLVGADINITDQTGKTPFALVFEPCSRCNNVEESHDQFRHAELFKVFATQVHKLQLCNLELSQSNEQLSSETFKKFDPDNLENNHNKFLQQLENASKLKIEPYTMLVTDFMSDNGAIVDYPLMPQDKRKTIDNFFRVKISQFQNEFEEVAGIIQLQYRKAILRRKIIDDAKDSLPTLMKFRLPDLCAHIVFRLLKNSDLQNLILSASN